MFKKMQEKKQNYPLPVWTQFTKLKPFSGKVHLFSPVRRNLQTSRVKRSCGSLGLKGPWEISARKSIGRCCCGRGQAAKRIPLREKPQELAQPGVNQHQSILGSQSWKWACSSLTLKVWIPGSAISQANHPPPKSLPPCGQRQIMKCLFWLMLLLYKGSFSVIGPCEESYCIFWTVRSRMAILKYNGYSHCLWRQYIHSYFLQNEREGRNGKVMCALDLTKGGSESSAKTPLKILLLILHMGPQW